jgi:dATP pyrophosphohydrolase
LTEWRSQRPPAVGVLRSAVAIGLATRLQDCGYDRVVQAAGVGARGHPHCRTLQVLLLERAAHPGYWQSVTGSQETGEHLARHRPPVRWPRKPASGASPADLPCATGSSATATRFLPSGATATRRESWYNTEHVFSLQVAGRPAGESSLAGEHRNSCWLPWRAAAAKCFSWPATATSFSVCRRVWGFPGSESLQAARAVTTAAGVRRLGKRRLLHAPADGQMVLCAASKDLAASRTERPGSILRGGRQGHPARPLANARDASARENRGVGITNSSPGELSCTLALPCREC